jgi:hypothetical protein
MMVQYSCLCARHRKGNLTKYGRCNRCFENLEKEKER